MALTCSRCSKINPDDAAYCHWDGIALATHNGAGPVDPGQQLFPHPFVFSSGQQCRNFDELALACQEHWAASVELLKQGVLEQFLATLGRLDLAQAARSAAGYPDADRGLDQLLAKLPGKALKPPQVSVEPKLINLGELPIGSNKTFPLHIRNAGGRLLYGSVVSDTPWVALGEKPGHAQKLFQCADSISIPVQIHGEHLRAGEKPIEAKLLIDTNGGRVSVIVRVQVPAKPFPSGVLAGAISPRQLAIKAKNSPKEAAVLFEKGLVAKWYKDNGWTYPVRGQSASGVAAVQQFFEALGLVQPPKVKISEQNIRVAGARGAQFEHSFDVFTDEKRFVYTNVASTEPWLKVSAVPLKNTRYQVRVRIAVPDYASGSLQGIVHVAANGNQRFQVSVQVSVLDGAVAAGNPPLLDTPLSDTAMTPLNIAAPTVEAIHAMPDDFDPPPLVDTGFSGLSAAAPVSSSYRRRKSNPLWHGLPALLLAFALLVILGRDVFTDTPPPQNGQTHVVIEGGDNGDEGQIVEVPIDSTQQLFYRYDPKKNFGLTVAKSGKLITYSPVGSTNSTMLRFNNKVTHFFGDQRFGQWVHEEEAPPTPQPGVMPEKTRTKNVWVDSVNRIQVTQVVDIVPSQQPVAVASGEFRRLLDNCLVAYQLENVGTETRSVGLRMQLDTLIGSNDGVPFTIPGLPGLVSTQYEFFKRDTDFPDFVQALEKPNLKEPGIVALLTVKVGGGLEAPDRVSLTRWPGHISGDFNRYDVPMRNIGNDSCAVMYWNDQPLEPGAKRHLGFAYGLGNVTADKESKLGLVVQGEFDPGSSFVVTALVESPAPGQTLELILPPGLKRIAGDAKETVPAAGADAKSVVTWHVRVEKTGSFPLEVRSSTGTAQRRTITISRSDPSKRPTHAKNIFR